VRVVSDSVSRQSSVVEFSFEKWHQAGDTHAMNTTKAICLRPGEVQKDLNFTGSHPSPSHASKKISVTLDKPT
jgi:hypothetical protein